MKHLFSVVFVIFSLVGTTLFAQNNPVWVQIEARPTLAQAQDRARAYETRLSDVVGYRLRSGWYGILLGPYERRDAQQVLNVYKAERRIPRDSFIALRGSLRGQYWPTQAGQPSQGTVTPELTQPSQDAAQAEATPSVPQTPSDETPAQARRVERDLSRDDRRLLQTALAWSGVYTSSIDGAFGRGTRRAMRAWQEQNNFEVTGILTTAQRGVLLKQYNSVLDGLGLEMVSNLEAGIQMMIPTEIVRAEKIEPPFVHYNATGDIPARLLLISQAGNRNTMTGLFDIMQTLEIVPPEGARQVSSTGFTLIGENSSIVSQTEVSLQGGEIKGFTLIWPVGDEDRRRRVISEMQASFSRLDGVLDPAAGNLDNQQIDLVSGLQVRVPTKSFSGFYIDRAGQVLTTSQAIAGCARVTLDEEYEASVVTVDDASGIAVLKPNASLSPPAVARLSTTTPRLQSDVAIAGYSFGGTLGAPSVTFGTLADLRGLNGEAGVKRINLEALPSDAGGPVLDAGGGLIGMLLPAPIGSRALPEGVNFAADRSSLQQVMNSAGVTAGTRDSGTPIAPEDLTSEATDMTVLVSCWAD